MNRRIAKAAKMVGGQTHLARELSRVTGRPFKQQHIWNWINREDEVPADVCIPIEQITDGGVTRYELLPHVFGDAPARSA